MMAYVFNRANTSKVCTMLKNSISWLLLPLPGFIACSGVPETSDRKNGDTGNVTTPIINGQNDTGGPVNDAVVGIQAPTGISGFCTGTLITSSLVLSAAHCSNGIGDGFSNPGPPGAGLLGSTIRLGVSAPFLQPRSESFAIEATQPALTIPAVVQTSPMVSVPISSSLKGSDLVILRIYPPIVSEAYARKPTFQAPENFEVGQIKSFTMTLVGWGLLADGTIPFTRQTLTKIAPLANSGSILRYDSSSSGATSGDSGGPLFIQGLGQIGVFGSYNDSGLNRWAYINFPANKAFIENTSAGSISGKENA